MSPIALALLILDVLAKLPKLIELINELRERIKKAPRKLRHQMRKDFGDTLKGYVAKDGHGDANVCTKDLENLCQSFEERVKSAS